MCLEPSSRAGSLADFFPFADFLASLVLDSPHSMPTTAPEAEAYAAALLAVLALPLSAKDEHMILAAATTKLVSPESQLDHVVDCLYLGFGDKLSELSSFSCTTSGGTHD